MEWARIVLVRDLALFIASLLVVTVVVSSSLLAVAPVVSISSTSAAFLDSLLGVDDLVEVVGVKSICHCLPCHGGSIMRPITVYLEQPVDC